MSQVPITGPGRAPLEGEKGSQSVTARGPLSYYEASSIAPASREEGGLETSKKGMSTLEYRSTIRNALFSFFQCLLDSSKKDALLAAALENSIGYENIPRDQEIREQYEKDKALLEKAQKSIDTYNDYVKKLQTIADRAGHCGDTLEDVWKNISGSSKDFEGFQKKYEELKANADLTTPEGQEAFKKGVEGLVTSSAELYRELRANDETFSSAAKDYQKAVEEFNQAIKDLAFTEQEWNEVKNLLESRGKRLPSLPDFPGFEDIPLYDLPEQKELARIPRPDVNSIDFSDPKALEAFEISLEESFKRAGSEIEEFENFIHSASASHSLNQEIIHRIQGLKPLPSIQMPSFESYQTYVLNEFLEQISSEAFIKLALAAGIKEAAASEIANYFSQFKKSRLDQPMPSAWGQDVPITGRLMPRSQVQKAHIEAIFREVRKDLAGEGKALKFVVDYTVFLESLSLVALRDAARLAPAISTKNAFALSFLKVLENIDDAALEKKSGGDQELKRAYYHQLDHLKAQLINYLADESDVAVLEKGSKLLKKPPEFEKQELKNPTLADYHFDQLLKGLDILELGVDVRSEELKTAPHMRGTTFSV